VTLARFKDRPGRGPEGRNSNLEDLLRQHQGWSAGAFEVTEVVTFASTLGPNGPAYTALARARLLGGKAATSP
jgi:2'-5' RNA ligase